MPRQNEMTRHRFVILDIGNYWCPVNFYSAYVLNSSVFKNYVFE